VKPVGMCWQMAIGAGKSRGSASKMDWITPGPPVDAPMTTASRGRPPSGIPVNSA